MLLTFTVTFSYLLLLHTGWHFWENGHTLVDAIIRISQKCQLFAAVRILLVSMKSYWMRSVLMHACTLHCRLSHSHGCTLERSNIVWPFRVWFFHWNVFKPSFFFIYFIGSSIVSAWLWQHVAMRFMPDLHDFNDSIIRCFTSSDKTQPSTNIPFYVYVPIMWHYSFFILNASSNKQSAQN